MRGLGMRKRHSLEIYIHPSLAYGFSTSIEKCISLRAIVTLLDIKEENALISDPDPIGLSFLLDSQIAEKRDEDYKKALLEKGVQTARHLEKCKEVSVEKITDSLRKLFSNREKSVATTQAEKELLNRVHWNIYYSDF